MTFETARPRYTLPFAGKDYELLGTMELIESVEYALKRGIVAIAAEVMNGMQVGDLTRLITAILTANGHKMTAKEAGDLLWNVVGLTGDDNLLFRVHLYSFLSVCLAPPDKREKKAKDAGELVGKLAKASPGSNTSDSASAS
jgi:hypothetical protein